MDLNGIQPITSCVQRLPEGITERVKSLAFTEDFSITCHFAGQHNQPRNFAEERNKTEEWRKRIVDRESTGSNESFEEQP